jgi:hypothetical protein
MAPGPELPNNINDNREGVGEPLKANFLVIKCISDGHNDQYIETTTLLEASVLAQINFCDIQVNKWLENPQGVNVYIADIRD